MSVKSAALLLALGAAAAPAIAQSPPVTLRVSAQVGQTARFQTQVETWLNIAQLAALGADTTRPTAALTIYTTRSVLATKADTVIIRDVVDSAIAAVPAIPGVNAADVAAAATSMRGVTTLSAVDGRGRLLEYAAGTTSLSRLDPPMQALMPQAGLLRMVFAFPDRAVRPGDTWTETLTTSEMDGSITLAATYTLERTQRVGNHSIAVIGIAGQAGGGGPDGALALRVTGRLEYDMQDSQPVRLLSDMTGQMASPAGSVPIRIRRTVTRL